MGNKPKLNKKRFLYPEEIQKILEITDGNQKFTILNLINTGARINEVRNITTEDLDKVRYNILLRKTKIRSKLGEVRPSPRIIAISSQFFKYLNKTVGKCHILSTNATNTMLKILCEKVRVKNPEEISAHNLRKTFGTWMLSLGCDGFKIAQHLGHTPNELARDYATNDIFNSNDKQIMREILGDLPSRLANYRV